jgi:hypothetical protein
VAAAVADSTLVKVLAVTVALAAAALLAITRLSPEELLRQVRATTAVRQPLRQTVIEAQVVVVVRGPQA